MAASRRDGDVWADQAVQAAITSADHPSGTPARREHLERAQVFATLALRNEVQNLNVILDGLGKLGAAAYRGVFARAEGNVVPFASKEDRSG